SENCSNYADRPAEKPNVFTDHPEGLRDIEQLRVTSNFWATSHPNQLEDPSMPMRERVKEVLQKLSAREKDVVLTVLMGDLGGGDVGVSETAGLLKISEHN